MADIGRPLTRQPAGGSSTPSPAVSALPGAHQAYRKTRASMARFAAMDAAYTEMLEHGLTGGPAYFAARDRFVELTEAEAPLRNQIPMGGML